MIEDTLLPAPSHLLAVASCPEELLAPMGAMISAFAERGAAVHAVLLSDGLSATGTATPQREWRHRLVRAAERLGITDVIKLDHPVADVPRTGVRLLTGEIVRAVERADAVLVADPADRRDRSARGRLAAFRAGLLAARAVGAQVYVCTTLPPSSRARSHAIEIGLCRTKQRSAMAYYNGIPEMSGRCRQDDVEVEYLLVQHRRRPCLEPLPH